MAHLRCDLRSETLDMNTSVTVVMPDGMKLFSCPVVYLLHGLADNCTGWSRYTSVERYARKYNAVLIMPEVQRSFYTDMAYGLDYFTYVHDELPVICHNLFNIHDNPEKTYVMGLSMGGYAALKCGLTSPDRYKGVCAFSAVTDFPANIKRFDEDSMRIRECKAMFTESLKIPEKDDLFYLLEKRNKDELPKIYMACGLSDELLSQSGKFAKALENLKADYLFEMWEGVHNWEFWDNAVCKAFRYMLIPG